MQTESTSIGNEGGVNMKHQSYSQIHPKTTSSTLRSRAPGFDSQDVSHFVSIRDILVQDVPTSIRRQSSVSAVQRGVSTESPSSVGS